MSEVHDREREARRLMIDELWRCGAEFSTPPDSCGDCERYVDAYRDAVEARVRSEKEES